MSNRTKIPITIVSSDAHSASAYTLTDVVNYLDAKLLQVRSSPVSRKPSGLITTWAFARNRHMQE